MKIVTVEALQRLARAIALASQPRELARVLAIAREVERDRLTRSPQDAIARARARGAIAKRRTHRARAQLKRVILSVDLFLGENCYRRTLLESSLDRGAAEEKILLGLDVGKTGHAWLESDPERSSFDVTFAV